MGEFFQSHWLLLLTLLVFAPGQQASDITKNAFGDITDATVAAFGDFNSDELTDVFIISNNSHTLEILLAADIDPLLRRSANTRCDFKTLEISSVVPGDFDGDAYMDLMITTKTNENNNILNVYINWGASDYLNCTDETKPPLFRMYGEPAALDYNRDMIIDLFGSNENKTRTFWLFGKDRNVNRTIEMELPHDAAALKIPHSHAYLDLNNDFSADLFVVTENGFEIWHGLEGEGFNYSHTIPSLTSILPEVMTGQSLFLDTELTGNITQLIPACSANDCNSPTIYVTTINGKYYPLPIEFRDDNNQLWTFIRPQSRSASESYQNTITLRGGDFNLDGYPDLLVTLTPEHENSPQTFLMENVASNRNGMMTRTFKIRWHAFAPFANGTVVGAFYDFYQDGILDVIFVESRIKNASRPLAFRNTLDYDANFVKVIVLTGLTNTNAPTKLTPLGRKKRTYGTNLPGPRIAYYTTKPDGDSQESTSVQIPQSAYFSLHLPYTIFGLGRTPNFVDSLTVGLSHRNRSWTQLIPNSQMVVVPWPPDEPSHWKAQLFVTPSKLIWMSVISLGATCLVIMFIILVLHIKEKREDRLERNSETQRFHFDAM